MRGKRFSRLQGRGEEGGAGFAYFSMTHRACDRDPDVGVSHWQTRAPLLPRDMSHPRREGPGHVWRHSVLHYLEEAPSARSAALKTAQVPLRRAAVPGPGG